VASPKPIRGFWAEDSHWERRALNAESELQACESLWGDCFNRTLYVCNKGLWPATFCREDDYRHTQYCKGCSGSSMAWED
jgi:hypothetical protein